MHVSVPTAPLTEASFLSLIQAATSGTPAAYGALSMDLRKGLAIFCLQLRVYEQTLADKGNLRIVMDLAIQIVQRLEGIQMQYPDNSMGAVRALRNLLPTIQSFLKESQRLQQRLSLGPAD